MMPRNFGLSHLEPVEIVKIAAPVLAEVVAVVVGIAIVALVMVIRSHA